MLYFFATNRPSNFFLFTLIKKKTKGWKRQENDIYGGVADFSINQQV